MSRRPLLPLPAGERPGDLAVSILITGSVASLASMAVLAALSRGSGGTASQPASATSHWLHGPRAGERRQPDLAHTGLGFLTHHLSAIFWAVPFVLLRRRRGRADALDVAADASAVATLAALTDYAVMPRRLTPGWEHVLPARSMPVAFAGLAAGLALGAFATDDRRRWTRKVPSRRAIRRLTRGFERSMLRRRSDLLTRR